MDFDRSKQTVAATRDFDHGVVRGEKGKPLSDEQLSDLSDAAIAHLVEIAQVAEIVDRKAAEKATGDETGKGGASQTGGKS